MSTSGSRSATGSPAGLAVVDQPLWIIADNLPTTEHTTSTQRSNSGGPKLQRRTSERFASLIKASMQLIRKPLLYPLSYEGDAAQRTYQRSPTIARAHQPSPTSRAPAREPTWMTPTGPSCPIMCPAATIISGYQRCPSHSLAHG